jgi:hypothetical protein
VKHLAQNALKNVGMSKVQDLAKKHLGGKIPANLANKIPGLGGGGQGAGGAAAPKVDEAKKKAADAVKGALKGFGF